MALYAYLCPKGHEIEREFPMGSAVEAVWCEDHFCDAARVYSAPSLILGDGFRKPWADRVQPDTEGRFRRRG